MNKVILIGNLTRDPETSTTNSGISMCKFAIAVSRRFAGPEGNKETDFFNITTWRQTADICGKFLHKGSKVCVVGSLQTRTYEGTDGTKKFAVDIIADEVEFLTPKSDSFSADSTETFSSAPKRNKIESLQPIEDGDLPF